MFGKKKQARRDSIFDPAAEGRKSKVIPRGGKNKKEKKARGVGGSRVVLMVGDEGGVLVHMKRGKVAERLFSPGPTSPETDDMSAMMRKIAKAPLYVVFDTVDQSYVQQALPPVTSLNVNKMIKRRLERDFSADYIKGAFALNRDKTIGGGKEWQFMIAALQQTPLVRAWINVIMQWPNPCKGIMLLPVETIEIINRLQRVMKKQGIIDDDKPADWQFLVTYNKVSGIRQIIFRKGRLVLTRLGQPAMDSSAETIAGTIEQEVISTREYLKRLAQQEKETQRVLILASEDICKNIDISKLRSDHVDIITPYQASEMLDLEGAAQPSDRFGDSFLCAALATNKKRQLLLSIPELRKQHVFTYALYGQRAVAACSVLGLAGYIGSAAWDALNIDKEIEELTRKQTAKQLEVENLKKKSSRTPDELDRIIAVADLFESINRETYRPDRMLDQLSGVLNEHVQVLDFSWHLRNPNAAPTPAAPAPNAPPGTKPALEGPPVDAALTVEFPAALSVDRNKLQLEVTNVLNQVKIKFPKYQVNYSVAPTVSSDNERIDVTLSQQGAAPKPEEVKAGPVQAHMLLAGPADTGEEDAAEQATKH